MATFTPESALALYRKAHDAGMAAGRATSPVPMVVVQHANPLDNSSPITKQYEPVMDGVCGMAWVSCKGSESFVRAIKKVAGAVVGGFPIRISDNYPTGKTVNYCGYGYTQSYERARM